MKKPEELEDLLETLKEEGEQSTVQFGAQPKALVYIKDKTLTLGKKDCSFLFNTPKTVEQFAEALGDTSEISIELQDLDLEDSVVSALESHFSTVDEV